MSQTNKSNNSPRTWMTARFFLVLLLDMVVIPVQGQECDRFGRCDRHERCPVWKDEGECDKERDYMLKYCPVSCSTTTNDSHNGSNPTSTTARKVTKCEDRHKRCHVWADLGECEANPADMHKYCAKSCGICGKDTGKNDDETQGVASAEDTPAAVEDEMEDEYDPNCKDSEKLCAFWAEHGECEKNPRYMTVKCARSCKSCPKIQPKRFLEEQAEMARKSENYGVLQRAEGLHQADTFDIIAKSVEYMESEQVANMPKAVRESCKNRHELCSFWTVLGECSKNEGYMLTNCAVACRTCHLIDFATRCPPMPDNVPALLPGDLNRMFERIVAEAPGNRTLTDTERTELIQANMTEYSVHILSRPGTEPISEISVVMDKSLPPWVIVLDNFITPEECDEMIQLGYKFIYKRSEDVGAEKFDGSHEGVQSTRRTSENAWCSSHQGCREEDLPQKLHQRIAHVLRIPPENSEDFQLLKYEKGQFYRTHHDYIGHQKNRQCGPRILTFFLYLSDVEEGGGTDFPQLNITVMPKKGSALLWPSVLNADPFAEDKRMMHQALDVVSGIKYGANAWIHMFDYVTPQKKGCT